MIRFPALGVQPDSRFGATVSCVRVAPRDRPAAGSRRLVLGWEVAMARHSTPSPPPHGTGSGSLTAESQPGGRVPHSQPGHQDMHSKPSPAQPHFHCPPPTPPPRPPQLSCLHSAHWQKAAGEEGSKQAGERRGPVCGGRPGPMSHVQRGQNKATTPRTAKVHSCTKCLHGAGWLPCETGRRVTAISLV